MESLYLQHEAVNFYVYVLVRLLGVAKFVYLHELLQTLPQVQSEKVDPNQAAGIQHQLQSVQLGVQVRTRDCETGRKKKNINISTASSLRIVLRVISYLDSLFHQGNSTL